MGKLPKNKSKKPWYREYSEALIVAAVLALIIRSFVVQAYKIPSGSMEDTLLIGDHLLVCKFMYGTKIPFTDISVLSIKNPARGDIIVFEFPEDANMSWWKRRDFIKRIVGLPGDRLEIRDKKLYINGEHYAIEQTVHKEARTIYPGTMPPPQDRRDFMPELQVPPGHYFVMGDNRDNSYDSRFWGFVAEDKIKGQAFIKYWSWNNENSRPRWGRIGRLIE
ncbi:MAG: signal peptidase I [Desulfuromonadaceae bacterium]|nr:signal peptidase I [Desulfuromonas sp.]MDY0185788.1 signal peptidase I [Desulfuromonadaceae bacterium]